LRFFSKKAGLYKQVVQYKQQNNKANNADKCFDGMRGKQAVHRIGVFRCTKIKTVASGRG
jgi:hypothetical protein